MSTVGERRQLQRDCPVVLIPSGQRAVLHQGAFVLVVQELGSSFTVQVERGPLVRIEGADADALGLSTPGPGQPAPAGGQFEMAQVMGCLRTVYDPEIPINVVDLGLIYSCEARPLPGGKYRVEVTMSMTAPGCGMGDVLREEARAKIEAVPGVAEADVQIVWDPPWDLSRLSDEARLQLGMAW